MNNFKELDINNKEQMREFMNSLDKDKIDYIYKLLFYFFPIWIEEKVKERTIKSLPKSDQDFLFQSILLMSFVSQNNQDKDNAVESEAKQHISTIISSIAEGNDNRISDLITEFKHRVSDVRKTLIEQIEEYKLKHLSPVKKKKIEDLKEQNGKEEIIEKIIKNAYKNDARIELLDDSIKAFDFNAEKLIDLSVSTSKALKLNPDYVQLLSNLVSNPSCLYPQEALNILNNVKIPNAWHVYRTLTISEYRDLCENLSDKEQWNLIFNRILFSIKDKIEVPLEAIQQRKEIITEILDSIKDQRFEIAMVSIYAELEGLLWDLSCEVNKSEKIYDSDATHFIDFTSKCVFETTRIREVIERTALKNYVDSNFLREFCKEIYEERNPILHGRQNCFTNCDNNAVCLMQKLMAMEYVLGLVIGEYQKNLFKQWDSMPLDVIERLINTYIKCSQTNKKV